MDEFNEEKDLMNNELITSMPDILKDLFIDKDESIETDIDDNENIIVNEVEIDLDNSSEEISIKNPVGRPKGIPASEFQKERVKKAALEYQQKIRNGEIDPPEPVTHGAYTFMQNTKIGKKKRHFLKYVYNERKKWLDELGGEENLTAIELSMLNEAARLLMYSTLVNAHLMKGETEIVFTDENGETKMHTALSKNYLSFTRTYVSILKELQKISTARPKSNNKGRGDVASRLQNLYNKE